MTQQCTLLQIPRSLSHKEFLAPPPLPQVTWYFHEVFFYIRSHRGVQFALDEADGRHFSSPESITKNY
jgi:hypothetical protein